MKSEVLSVEEIKKMKNPQTISKMLISQELDEDLPESYSSSSHSLSESQSLDKKIKKKK